ncbi:hypothetical protein Sj15T_00690 [Sphingobium sp. TA15]|uniref:Uncharacterized protein n=2 Tax=Sphingobium indicum TaxID=332055 RepID=D4YZD8_SPHIU|nr:hypothetical protein [Sphingobium indicum]EPR16126.1 hypothetical protein M527_22390 [Sphingobium indicum IP26]KER35169.1 hypothetical protein AL00_17585 [Sphingobium indicum F2]BAI95720.1 hypothetical protein SJA_C1-08860 [Sphingobium indicum UT26S]BDD65048.1 hypothetical protein Sj15T_00690 [Sphingobium sp. TA15]
MDRLKEMGETVARRIMVGAAITAIEAQGYSLKRQPGRGLSAVYDAVKGNDKKVLSIRTTRDRWFAFPSLKKATAWKTLDDSDLVSVAAVDDVENPQAINVYLFPADEVRKRFDESRAARIANGHNVKDDWGMWVMLDKGDDNVISQIGHSLAVDYPPIATYTLDELEGEADTVKAEAAVVVEEEIEEEKETAVALKTVADVLAFAQERIAALTGMPVEGIKLDLKMGV